MAEEKKEPRSGACERLGPAEATRGQQDVPSPARVPGIIWPPGPAAPMLYIAMGSNAMPPSIMPS